MVAFPLKRLPIVWESEIIYYKLQLITRLKFYFQNSKKFHFNHKNFNSKFERNLKSFNVGDFSSKYKI
jgi:hypothetical protein